MLLGYYVFAAAVLSVWYVILRAWDRGIAADVQEGAVVDWQRIQRQEPDLLKGLTEEEFAALYARVESPRGPFYTLLSVAIFLFGAPLVLALNSFVIGVLERTGAIAQPADQARQLKLSSEGIQVVSELDLEALQYILQGWGGFFSFFSLLAFWVAVFFVVMRHYHRSRPGSLRDEILRAR